MVTSLSGLIKGILLAVLTAMMLLLVALALAGLAGVERGPDDTAGTVPPPPPDPLAEVPLGPTGTEGSISCYRPEGEDPTFIVQLDSPADDVATWVVGIDLVGPGGERDPRTVSFAEVGPDSPVLARVADSADPARFVDCTVTAIQGDKQVLLTGR